MRFAHVVVRRMPGAGSSFGSAVEVFTIGTRLTRITRGWGTENAERALRRRPSHPVTGPAAPGSANALHAFIDSLGGSVGWPAGRSLVIFSDGWERGDPGMLAEQLARLRRLAHRIHLGQPARRQGRLRPGAGRNSRGLATLG